MAFSSTPASREGVVEGAVLRAEMLTTQRGQKGYFLRSILYTDWSYGGSHTILFEQPLTCFLWHCGSTGDEQSLLPSSGALVSDQVWFCAPSCIIDALTLASELRRLL